MSQTSSQPDPRVDVLAASVQAAEPDLHVQGGRVCAVPYADVTAVVEVLVDRQLNILEEFILRAAHELDPAPTLPDLAAMLGLDPLFVETSWQRMETLDAVTFGAGGAVQLTELGETFYAKGQLPPTAIEETLDLRYWAATDGLEIADGLPRSAGPDVLLPGLGLEDEDGVMAALSRAVTDAERVAGLTVTVGMDLHLPDEGRALSEVKSWSVAVSGTVSVALLVVAQGEPSGGQNVSFRALDLASGSRDLQLESVLEGLLAEGNMDLADLLAELPASDAGVPSVELAPSPSPEGTSEAGPEDDTKPPTEGAAAGVKPLADLELVGEAQHTVLIHEPGATETVVGAALANLLAGLASRGVITVIGTGAKPAVSLRRRLDEAVCPLGYPCAIVVPLEAGEAARIVVDGVGVDTPSGRDETPADGEAVRLAEAQIADAVASAWAAHVGDLQRAGAGAVPSETTEGMARCCSAWVAVGAYATALESIIDLLDVETDALPLGFRLAVVTLTALQRLPDGLLAEQADVELLREAVIDIDTRFTDVPEEQYADDEARLNETWRTLRRRLAAY